MNIYKNFTYYLDFLVRVYLNISLQDFTDNTPLKDMSESPTSESIFCGMEYLNFFLKKCTEFLIVGSELNSPHREHREKETLVINSMKNLDTIYDKQLGLESLLEETPVKMVFNYDTQKELF